MEQGLMSHQSIEGLYRDGEIILSEIPEEITGEVRVIVTFLADTKMSSAAELRARLKTFAEDWENPDMDVYDDYDAAKNNL